MGAEPVVRCSEGHLGGTCRARNSSQVGHFYLKQNGLPSVVHFHKIEVEELSDGG